MRILRWLTPVCLLAAVLLASPLAFAHQSHHVTSSAPAPVASDPAPAPAPPATSTSTVTRPDGYQVTLTGPDAAQVGVATPYTATCGPVGFYGSPCLYGEFRTFGGPINRLGEGFGTGAAGSYVFRAPGTYQIRYRVGASCPGSPRTACPIDVWRTTVVAAA